MTDITGHDMHANARAVLSGLVPTIAATQAAMQARRAELKTPSTLARNLMTTVPIVLVGSMAMMNLTGPASPVDARPAPKPKSETSDLGALRSAVAAATVAAPAVVAAPVVQAAAIVAAPRTYKVGPGDTVSSIAVRYGLSTASVLALNGLGWKSLIFPGQVLQLTKASAAAPVVKPVTAPVTVTKYTIVKGDTISKIAARFKITTTAVLKANGLGWASVIHPGQKITIPKTASTPVVVKPPVVVTPPVVVKPPVVVTPPVVVKPPVVVTPPASSGNYVIKSGDTISKIAKQFNVTITAILTANKLTASSIIYAGRTLVIPGVSATPAGNVGVTLLSGEQETNARTIIRIGRELGVSDYGIVVALSAAMQESTMRNISYGHLDSVGLFQQRPSSGWGTIAQLTTPAHAARLFYGGLSNPNKGKTRGLLDYAGWQLLTVTQAAQKVQVSAYPDAYAKWEASARFWLAEMG